MFFKKKTPAQTARRTPLPIDPPSANPDEVAQAAALDAEGRHEEAVDALRRGWVEGSIEATRKLGERLLIGRDVTAFPQEGFALISAAAERGDAQALRIMGNLSAAGSMTPQDWPKALDYLAKAAEQGCESAGSQLKLLSKRDGADWAKMAKDIDLEAWLAPCDREPICESPRVRIGRGLCPPEICDWLVEAARLQLRPAKMYDIKAGGPILTDTRRCSEFQFDVINSDVVLLLIRARISALIKMPVFAMEPPQVFRYQLGEEIKAHFDVFAADKTGYGRSRAFNSERIVSSILYLNDDFEGGELNFVKADLKHKGRKGDIVYFANVHPSGEPDTQALHAGLPVTRGEKWVMSQWIHNQPFTAEV